MHDPVDLALVEQLIGSFPLFHPVPRPFLAELVAESAKVPARVWQAALAGLSEAAAPTETGTISAPTLIVWGDRDDFLPRAEQEAMAAAIPASRLVIYPGTGHLVLWEQPERLAADVTAFATGLDARR
jgi:rifampin ADP-ribosylating transferase